LLFIFQFTETIMKPQLHRSISKKTAVLWCAFATLLFAASGCTGGSVSTPPGTGMVTVSISDPPSCMAPNGSSTSFTHVFITVRSVQAHIDPRADDNSSNWQELAPQLANAPMQIDLFATPTNCVLAQLGSASLPVGSYQQIRLLLVSNSPGTTLTNNQCLGLANVFNCVELSDNSFHELQLSSEANTGLKIPPGQIVGGPIQVMAGQSVDLNIDFNACASIVLEGNGSYRLKPTLTAGQVSPNNSGIGGQVVDSLTKAPIAGKVLVAVEQTDSMGVDRVVMQAATDANGNFRFCPLPTGPFDIVIDAVTTNNVPYNATVVLNVPNGTDLNTIPLIAETGATAPAVLQGFVTATKGASAATADVTLAALQTVSPGGSSASRQITVPLETILAVGATAEVDSTELISVESNTNCPVGAPANSNCKQYTLVVPASNPNVGVFSSSGVSFTAPASGDVLYTVDARAFVPMSGGTADCTPPEVSTSKDDSNMPLKAIAAMTTKVARIDFSGCS
jgi:uncharacterized protein DUF4382